MVGSLSLVAIYNIESVYNLTVDDTHSYFVGTDELLGHNSKGCSFPSKAATFSIHVVRGEVSSGGRISGYHSRYGGYDHGLLKIDPSTVVPGKRGVYEAMVVYVDANGRRHAKSSTFFPDGWDPSKIMREIDSAVLNYIGRHGALPKTGKIEGRSASNVRIGLAIENGQLTSAWPKLK